LRTLSIPRRLVAPRFDDARGWFSESYSRRRYSEFGVDIDFVQDNHSYSASRGTLRGVHFQLPPHAQAKLVRCISGAIWDVAVDLRTGSPSFGQWVAAELTASGGEQLYIPAGFGHGFITLLDNVEVVYKTSDYFAPEFDAGIAWDDPDASIKWPLSDLQPILSHKDNILPKLKDFVSPFRYDGTPLAPLD
jgi:dTDP-4-dehydrorhamnose 3,5-epimerase